MKKMSLFSKLTFAGFLSICCVSFALAFSGFLQTETSTDAWFGLARALGMGAVGIISIIAITRLIQVLKGRNDSGDKALPQLLVSIQNLDKTIALLNESTQAEHERMLNHDADMIGRLEALTTLQHQAVANQSKIVDKEESIIKQLDRMERNAEKEGN